jgi:hypothetical protein
LHAESLASLMTRNNRKAEIAAAGIRGCQFWKFVAWRPLNQPGDDLAEIILASRS